MTGLVGGLCPTHLCQTLADLPELRVIHQLPSAVQRLLAKAYCACDLSHHVDICCASCVGLALPGIVRALQESVPGHPLRAALQLLLSPVS